MRIGEKNEQKRKPEALEQNPVEKLTRLSDRVGHNGAARAQVVDPLPSLNYEWSDARSRNSPVRRTK